MICKDCFHFDVCKNATIPNPDYKGAVADKSKECGEFAIKSDYTTVDLDEIRKETVREILGMIQNQIDEQVETYHDAQCENTLRYLHRLVTKEYGIEVQNTL